MLTSKHRYSATVEQEPCYTVQLWCAPPVTTTVVVIAMFTLPPSPAGKLLGVGHPLLELTVFIRFTNSVY